MTRYGLLGDTHERLETRRRYLYVLWFGDGTCYVGQSVAPSRRASQHRRDWGRPFTLTVVGSRQGTYAELERWEHIWRARAALARVKVWASPGYLIPRLHADPSALAQARRLRWPRLPYPVHEKRPDQRSVQGAHRAA